MASFNIPSSPSKYTMVVDSFRGVDLLNSPTNVEKSRSPAAPNMIRDQVGKVRKRMGYQTVATAPEGARINGVHYLGEERLDGRRERSGLRGAGGHGGCAQRELPF